MSPGTTSSCLLLFSSSLGTVVGTGGSEEEQKKHINVKKMAHEIISAGLFFETFTFNSEVELA